MAKKVNNRRQRIRKANHGSRPAVGKRPRNIKGTGRK